MSGKNTKTIGIIEREYLIAIDLQRIIEDNFDCDVHILAVDTVIDDLQLLTIDLILFDAASAPVLAAQLLESGATIQCKTILLTLDNYANQYDDPMSATEIVSKPFTDEQIVKAISAALAR